MKRGLLILIIGIFVISGCKEFIEASLEDSKVVLLAPGDKFETNRYNVNFWWEPVADAISYRLQIVSPAFDSLEFMVLDTLVRSDKFAYILEPGKYEWRVRAENGSSQSFYTSRSFIVYESSIKNQQIVLNRPADKLISNQQSTTFSWEKLFGATVYRLQIDTNNFSNENSLYINEVTSNTEFQVNLAESDTYRWRVRAENDTAQSKWSVVNQLNFDKTPPAALTLIAPDNGQTVNNPVLLQWDVSQDTPRYQLYLFKSDSTTIYSPAFPMQLSTNSYSLNTGTSSETLYWRVRGIDAAGNLGDPGQLRNFTIQ